MNADGTNARRVKAVLGLRESEPAFSPDGTQLVFTALRYGGHSSLMIINVDGAELRQLTTGDVYDSIPRWSRRGIVFSSNRTNITSGLWLIQPDGSGLRFLHPTTTPGPHAVSSDGTRVAFYDPSGAFYEFNILDDTVRPLKHQMRFHIVVRRAADRANQGRHIRVAIPSVPDLDPMREIDQSSITFGVTGDERSLVACAIEFELQIKIPILICRFDIGVAGFGRGAEEQGILRAIDIRRNRLLEGRALFLIPP
jgi:dipeptidyl aminopeptidase/acylaminoacyl peptidase